MSNKIVRESQLFFRFFEYMLGDGIFRHPKIEIPYNSAALEKVNTMFAKGEGLLLSHSYSYYCIHAVSLVTRWREMHLQRTPLQHGEEFKRQTALRNEKKRQSKVIARNRCVVENVISR